MFIAPSPRIGYSPKRSIILFTSALQKRARLLPARSSLQSDWESSCTKVSATRFAWPVAAEPQEEVRVAWEIVKSLGLRTRGVTVVACPTCGRLDVDNFVGIVTEIERRLAHIEEPLHLSIMGCAVNGPGEAHDSQLGITFGRGVGMIFKDGVPMRKVAGENIVEAFVMETEKLLAEIKNWAVIFPGDVLLPRRRLP